LKSKTGWSTDKGYKAATDDYGFSALPGGYGNGGGFGSAGYNGSWWSATEYDADIAWHRYMYGDDDDVYRSYEDESYLCSLRCLKDKVAPQ